MLLLHLIEFLDILFFIFLSSLKPSLSRGRLEQKVPIFRPFIQPRINIQQANHLARENERTLILFTLRLIHHTTRPSLVSKEEEYLLRAMHEEESRSPAAAVFRVPFLLHPPVQSKSNSGTSVD